MITSIKKDLKIVIKKYEQQFLIGETNDIAEVPIYDKEEINTMERAIEKAKLMSRFKKSMDIVDDNHV